MMLPSGAGGRTTTTVGYFECELGAFVNWLDGGFDDTWKVRAAPGWASLADAASYLAPSVPLSRYACVAVGSWTLLLNNGPLGTDVGVLPRYAARELECRAIRAVCNEEDYPARMLDVYGPKGDSENGLERSVAAANDGGRWIFETYGEPFSFEDQSFYKRRVKAERFPSSLLYQYLRALHVPIDVEPWWSTAVLVEQV